MEEVFFCYRGGLLSSLITFSPEKIIEKELSYYTGNFQKPKEVPGNNLFHPSVFEIWRLSGSAKWDEDIIKLGDYVFEKYQNVYDKALGEGFIYAQLNTATAVDVVVNCGNLVGFMLPGRNESITIVKYGYQRLTNLALYDDGQVSSDRFTIESLGELMVPMRDGIKLSTAVSLPRERNGEQLPTILIRTCYNKNENKLLWDKYVKRGYGVVVQDVRGRETSEGEWLPFMNEMHDGDDTLNWIAEQPWSNGCVGMLGGSYLGFVQWAAAASGNKHLKAIVSQVTAGSPFVDLPRRGGTFGSGALAWSFLVAKQNVKPEACVREDWEKLLAHRPISEIPKLALGESIPFYDQWMEHPCNDEFWKRADWSIHEEKIDVPALYVSGWFDDDGPGTTMAWAMNSKNKRKNQRMILGPWLHKANSSRKIHHYSLPKNALRYDLDCIYLRWFDRFLKGMKNGVETEASVEYYMLGDHSWRSSKAWPPENMVPRKMYLSAKNSAMSSEGDGVLSFTEAKERGISEYICDPYNPFPYLIDVSENECAVPEDYQEAEKRMDVLVYTSELLTQEIEIAGDVFAYLSASSSCLDTDWVVRLTDVGPDESSTKLADGILRARYRYSFEEPVLLTPDQREEYTIKMTRIAHTFKPGHRIRLQITSGADNLCFANSNTGECESQTVILKKAKNRVYQGGEKGRYIVWPILK